MVTVQFWKISRQVSILQTKKLKPERWWQFRERYLHRKRKNEIWSTVTRKLITKTTCTFVATCICGHMYSCDKIKKATMHLLCIWHVCAQYDAPSMFPYIWSSKERMHLYLVAKTNISRVLPSLNESAVVASNSHSGFCHGFVLHNTELTFVRTLQEVPRKPEKCLEQHDSSLHICRSDTRFQHVHVLTYNTTSNSLHSWTWTRHSWRSPSAIAPSPSCRWQQRDAAQSCPPAQRHQKKIAYNAQKAWLHCVVISLSDTWSIYGSMGTAYKNDSCCEAKQPGAVTRSTFL